MKGLKKGDIIIAAAIILISAALFLISVFSVSESDGLFAEISVDGAVIMTLPLNADSQFDTGTGVFVSVENGEVYINESDCPDKLCIRAGAIKKPGQLLVCLPNRVVVKIVSETGKREGVDAVA